MPGAWFRMPDGLVMHVKFGAPRRKRCKFCPPGAARFATILCDHEIAPGKTCDAPCCSGCARPVGPDRDLCPDHQGRLF